MNSFRGFPTQTPCGTHPSSIHATCPTNHTILDFVTPMMFVKKSRLWCSPVWSLFQSSLISLLLGKNVFFNILFSVKYLKYNKLFILCTVHECILCRVTADWIPVALRRAHGHVTSATNKTNLSSLPNSNNAQLSAVSELRVSRCRPSDYAVNPQRAIQSSPSAYNALCSHVKRIFYTVVTFTSRPSHLTVSFKCKFEPSGSTITVI